LIRDLFIFNQPVSSWELWVACWSCHWI